MAIGPAQVLESTTRSSVKEQRTKNGKEGEVELGGRIYVDQLVLPSFRSMVPIVDRSTDRPYQLLSLRHSYIRAPRRK